MSEGSLVYWCTLVHRILSACEQMRGWNIHFSPISLEKKKGVQNFHYFLTTCDKIVILFFINIYGFHLILSSQLHMPHVSLRECSMKMSAGAALRRALMATCMMWIPYVDSNRNLMYPRRIIPTQSPRRVSHFMVRISSVCLRSRRRWNITRSDQRIWMNHSAVWGTFSLRGESHRLIGFSTFRSNPL